MTSTGNREDLEMFQDAADCFCWPLDFRDALIISLVDTVTSFVAGVTLFAILGNLASRSQKEISFMIASGPKLLFVTYPEAIGQFDVAPQVFCHHSTS